MDKKRRTEQMLRKLKEQYPTFLPEAPATPVSTTQPVPSGKMGKRGSISNKFGASVKQTWVSKKKVSKRERRKSIVVGAAESSVRMSNSIRIGMRQLSTNFAFADGESRDSRDGDDRMKSGSVKASAPRTPFSRRFLGSTKIAVTDETIHEHEEADQEAEQEPDLDQNQFQHQNGADMQGRDESFQMTPTPPLQEEKSQQQMSHSPSFGGLSQENSTVGGRTFKYDDNGDRARNTDSPSQTSPRYVTSDKGSTVEDTVGFSTRRRLQSLDQVSEKVSVKLPSFPNHRSRALSYRHSASPKAGGNGGGGAGGGAGNVWEEEESAIADVFFLSWPELYLEAVQSLIMIIALYFALYFTNFIVAAESPAWKGLTLMPAVASSLLLVYIVKSAVILSALHAVDCDAILEVLDQTEGARALSALMKEKVMALLNEMGPDPEVELYNLFSEVDSDHSGAISRDEFAEYMNSIEIHFDRRRWMQVFRGIDTTFDNKITFEEFFVFMFPSTSHGKVPTNMCSRSVLWS